MAKFLVICVCMLFLSGCYDSNQKRYDKAFALGVNFCGTKDNVARFRTYYYLDQATVWCADSRSADLVL